MISLKEYKAAKDQVDQFERSVKVAAIVNDKIVNFSPDDLTVIPTDKGILITEKACVDTLSPHLELNYKELRSLLKGGGQWVVEYKDVYSNHEYRLFDASETKEANQYYKECEARTKQDDDESYDIEWVDINWYAWADIPEEALP
jgi:hypothetical protein